MTIRLSLALLALPLILFAGSTDPYECPARAPVAGPCETPTGHAANFCNLALLEIGNNGKPRPGSCLKPFLDCFWQFNIQATNCTSGVARIEFSSNLPCGGEQTICSIPQGNSVTFGPVAIKVDCGQTDFSPVVTFFDAAGTNLGHCHFSFTCEQCKKRKVRGGLGGGN